MYFPGKIIEVLKPGKEVESSDGTAHAVLETFDENIIIAIVNPTLNENLKKDQVVIFAANTKHQTAVREFVLIKILLGKTGERVWKKFKDQFEKQKKRRENRRMPGELTVPVERAREMGMVR